MNLFDTIAAVSTPYGKGGVAMIRISGKDAISIGDKVFSSFSGKSLFQFEHGKMTYGEIFMPEQRQNSVDDGMAVVFRAPHSFTGEDTVEITCHGGIFVTRKVLSAVLAAGARIAEAGEFTRRAYVSGRLTLTEAEALGNMLEATSESQLTLARSGMKGRLSERIGELYDTLKQVLSNIYAVIDFPDDELSDMSREELQTEILSVSCRIAELAATYGTGRAVSEGIPTVICGRANVGKSSVYNRILGYDAAIVTDVEGTTRDVLRENAILGRTTLLLCDTAGLRVTDDRVESIGIERSLREIDSASLILAVFDGTEKLSTEDIGLAEKVAKSGISAIALVNKADSNKYVEFPELNEYFGRVINISALSGEGFDELIRSVDELFVDGKIDMANDAVVTGARQYASLASSQKLLEKALDDIRSGVSLDACCVDIECAMSALGEVDGREIGEEIVAEIFSRFCVGK